MKKFFLCISLLFLLSCEMSVTTEMYITDIINFTKNKNKQEELFLNCSIDFEISSEDEYNKNPEKYINILNNAFLDVKDPVIKNRDLSTYLSAKGKISFLKDIQKAQDIEKSLIYLTYDEDDKYIKVYFNIETDKYQQLNYTIKENTYQDIKMKDFNICIDLQNDRQEPCEITVYSSYVNNEPILYNKTFQINKRENLNIILSNIFKDYSMLNGKECFIKILKSEKKNK